MRIIFGLLFLAWGSSIIFNFDFNFFKYLFPLFLIGIGLDIIFKDNEYYKKYKREKKEKKYSKRFEKHEETMKTVNDKKEEDLHE